MTTAVWYRIGSVTVTQGQSTVVGNGTLLTTQVNPGDVFTIDNVTLYEIQSITDDTHFVLDRNYVGQTAANSAYAIIRNFNYGVSASLASRVTLLLNQYQTALNGVLGGQFADGLPATPGLTFALQTNVGLFRPAYNMLGITLGGSEVQRWDASGNLLNGASSNPNSANLLVYRSLASLIQAVSGTNTQSARLRLDVQSAGVSTDTLNAIVNGPAAASAVAGIAAGANGFSTAVGPIAFAPAGTERARLTATGQFLLGYAADAGGGQSIQINGSGLLSGNLSLGGAFPAFTSNGNLAVSQSGGLFSTGDGVNIGSNIYFSGGQPKYTTAGHASNYIQSGGAHYFYSCPTGTAGSNATQSQIFKIDSSGNLISAGNIFSLGGGGTGGTIAAITLNGGTANAAGSYLAFQSNGVGIGGVGQQAAVQGGTTSLDVVVQSQGATNNTNVASINGVVRLLTGTGYTAGLIVQTTQSITLPHYGAGTATFDASGNITSASDERLKLDRDGISPVKLGSFLGSTLGIRPILHRWRPESGMETENIYAGFSAQDVQKHIPEAVGQQPDGYLTLQDRALLAAAVNDLNRHDRTIKRLTGGLVALSVVAATLAVRLLTI